jgi:hypothetical protein
MAHPKTPIWEDLCLELRLANYPPTKDCTAAMGYCMTSDHDHDTGRGGGYAPKAPSGRQMGHIRTGQPVIKI